MDINELYEKYVKLLAEEDKNLVNVAFDEMKSSQHEEAANHFDQLYVKDSTNYMAFYFRAYNKSFLGKRGDVYPDAQTLTSAFNMACKKALAAKGDAELNLSLIVQLYREAMENLADNAVEEVDSNGHSSNPDRTNIKKMLRENMIALARDNAEAIKGYTDLKAYVVEYLKKIEHWDLKNIGAVIVTYDPSYAETYQKKLKKSKIIKVVVAGVAFAIVLAIVLAIAL